MIPHVVPACMHVDAHTKHARLILQAYILGIPLWWFLGLDFILLQVFVALLVVACPIALQRFTIGDYLLVALIATFGASAYVFGFLVEQKVARFVAALYNLSVWVCGLILVMQVRHLWTTNAHARLSLLRTAHLSFVIVMAVCWGSFIFAYVVDNFSLSMPSVFGFLAGNYIPGSAPLVQRHASLVYTLVDWGLPGVPMPRVQVFGPYPTATAATVAVLGSLSLLYLKIRRPTARLLPLCIEGAILATIAITLTRSMLSGWCLGMIAANLLFGGIFRKVGAVLAAVSLVGLVIAGVIDPSKATEYRSYSSESRFDSYLDAVTTTMMANPILGLGIKPREDSHIPVGSHSTIISAFTKSGILGLIFAVLFLFLRPFWRWAFTWMACATCPHDFGGGTRAELRILFNLQIAVWVWLGFEDLDAPATAAALIFVAISLIEQTTRRTGIAATATGQPASMFDSAGRRSSSGASS